MADPSAESPVSSAYRREEALIIAISILAITYPLYALHDFVPIFDGGWVLGAVLSAAMQSLRLDLLNWGDHDPSFFYLGILAIPQYLFGLDITLLHATNFALFLVFLAYVYSLTTLATRSRVAWSERLLFSVVVGSLPVIWVNLLNLSLNFGAMIFGTALLYHFIRWHPWRFSFWGMALCFSHETGVLVYGLFGLTIAIRAVHSISKKQLSLLNATRDVAICALPGIAFLAYSFLSPNGSSLTNSKASKLCWGTPQHWTVLLYTPHLLSKPTHNYIFNLTALNFNWIFSLSAIASAFVLGSRFKRGDHDLPPRESFTAIGWITLALLFWVYGITRCPLFNNPKYVVTALPLVPILSYSLLAYALRARTVRICFLLAVLVTLHASLWKSFDPVSKAFYGTFDFGSHKLYSMNSRTGECCGFGQDQLLYNLEMTSIHYINDSVIQKFRPTPDRIMSSRVIAWTFDHFEAGTFMRHFGTPTPLDMPVLEPQFAVRKDSPELIFVVYPFRKVSEDFKIIEEKYSAAEVYHFSLNGYGYPVVRYVRKEKE